MKILMISSIYPTKAHPDYGTFVRNIRHLYEDNGHEVELIAYQREGGKLTKLRNWLVFFRSIRQALARPEDYDLINLHYPFLAAFPIANALNTIKQPLWISLHGSDVFPDSRLKSMAIDPTVKLLEYADRIIVPSAFFQAKVMKQYRLPQEKFRVIAPGGFSDDFYPPNNNTETKKIGFVGRFVAGKGWPTLLEAFRSIAHLPEMAGYSLHLVGSGADRELMVQTIRQHGLSDRICLHQSMPQPSLAEFYRGLDFFVFPTLLEESLGMVAIEALACGVPVIASRIGAVEEYIVSGVNGYLVEPGSVNQLARAMRELITQDEATSKAMRQAALTSAERYRESSVRAAIDRMIEELR